MLVKTYIFDMTYKQREKLTPAQRIELENTIDDRITEFFGISIDEWTEECESNTDMKNAQWAKFLAAKYEKPLKETRALVNEWMLYC